MLPFVLHLIDKGILASLNDQPPNPPPQTDHHEEIQLLNKKIEMVKGKIQTATLDTAIALTDTLNTLIEQRACMRAEDSGGTREDQSQDAVDEWEEFVKPILIPVITGGRGEGNPIVQKLGIGAEVDRLFNTTLIRPSVLRQKLIDLDARVELWFQDATKRGQGMRHRWAVDYGKLTATIGGQLVFKSPSEIGGLAVRTFPKMIITSFRGEDLTSFLQTLRAA